jgi:transposase
LVRGLMTDEEWAFFRPFVVATEGKRCRPPSDHRHVPDGVFWIGRTGASWRDLHDHFGPWTRVYRQFRRWTLSGVWEMMLEALGDSGAVPMIPARRNRKTPVQIDNFVYGLRNRIERCFNKLRCSRRLATRYDKTADSYLGFIHLASTRLWFRHLVNRT